MKYFFTAFYKSLYDSVWLRAARTSPGKAWSYFCLLVFVFSLIAIVPLGLEFHPLIDEFGRDFRGSAPDFSANLKGGKLTIDKLKQPFVFRSDDLILIVDTVSTSSVALEQLVTTTEVSSILITSDRAELHNIKTGEGRVQSFANLPDFTFSKDDAVVMIGRLSSPSSAAFAILAIFIGLYVGFFIVKLYDILLVTLLILVLGRIFGRAMKFAELLTIGLYAVTLPSLIALLAVLIGLEISYLQFMALLAFMLAVVFTTDGGEVEGQKSKV